MTSRLAPGFLVASPSQRDPTFQRSVVMIVEHRPEGGLGFVVNRPGKNTLASLIAQLGLRAPETPTQYSRMPVLVGGPVAPHTGWIVFDIPSDPVASREDVVVIASRIGVSSSRGLLEEISAGNGPQRSLVVVGYSGWGPGQLESELSQGWWIPVDLDFEILFDLPHEERWQAALAKLGIDPGRVVGTGVLEA